MRNVRCFARRFAALAVVLLAGCGPQPGGDVAEAGGSSSGGQGGGDDSAGDPLCVVSSDGQTICPDPAQRYVGWDTYAIREDGRTVDVTFSAPGEDCAVIDEASGEILPTEVHVGVSLRRTGQGCELEERTAVVRLPEPVAGRPVYSTYSAADAAMSTRGYVGAVDGPQCLGPRPAPRAHIDRCPVPTNQPPAPLATKPKPGLQGARTVAWTAAALEDHEREVVLQWISTDCARLSDVAVKAPEQQAAVVLTVREVPCKGDVVVRSTTVDLGRRLGNRRVIDGTYFTP